jgi:O-antigen/teichoic acid export membrane protein
MKKQAWKYAITTAGILALGFLVGNQAAVFFIGIYCPVDAVGFYNLATRIGVFFHIFPMAFAYVLLPIVAEKFGSGENETIKEVYSTSLRFLMPIVLPLAVGGIALAAPIVTFLYGPDYEQTIALLQVLLIFYSIGSLMDGGTSVIRGINQPGFLLMIRIICAAVNIGMSLWLIPKIGVIGATLAFGMTALIMFPSYSIFIYKKVGARFPVGDALKAVTASLIMGAVVYLVNIQISSSILSMAVGIPLGVIVYLVAIFALRYVRKEDLSIIRRVLNSLPAPLKRVSSAVTDFAEKFM